MMEPFVSIRRLTEAKRPELAATFERMADMLAGVRKGRPVQLQLSILDGEGEEPTPWAVTITKQGGKAAQRTLERPDVEIITRAETWWQIAEGRLSPVEAFVTGRLRVRGNIEQAKRIFLMDLAAEPAKLPTWLR